MARRLRAGCLTTAAIRSTHRVDVEGAAWIALTASLCLGAVLVALHASVPAHSVPGSSVLADAWPGALDWRPGLGVHAAWRLWTCAWVHWSTPHLAVNLLGAGVVGTVGWRARVPTAAAAAWFIGWPLTHLLMNVPDSATLASSMPYYAGLSGVLHAGAIVLGLTLAWPEENAALTPLTPTQAARHRWIGGAIIAGTVAKVLLESPWNLVPRPDAMLGIASAPLAHACGIVAGALAWSGVALVARLIGQPGPSSILE